MRAIVIYESMFGDNQQVAGAIVEGLVAAGALAQAIEVGHAEASIAPGTDLLVVGSPNHGWSMPREGTRQDAATRTDRPLVSQGIGVREWLTLAHLPEGQRVAAYDTRASGPRVVVAFDHASTQIEHGLTKLGGHVVAPAEHFLVAGQTGPLEPGELDRARTWGTQLAGLASG